jgi:hypothetical protein
MKNVKRKELFNNCIYWVNKCCLKDEYTKYYNKSKLIRHLYNKFPNELKNKYVDISSERKILNYIHTLTQETYKD